MENKPTTPPTDWPTIERSFKHLPIKIHELKTWPEHFEQIRTGQKTFEIRNNDRNFLVDEYLFLHEFNRDLNTYTGRGIIAKVTHILPGGSFGVENGFCIMSIKTL